MSRIPFLVLLLSSFVSGQAAQIEQLVQQQYPPVLMTRMKGETDLLNHKDCWAVYAGTESQPVAIVAAYADGAVTILQQASNGWRRSASVTRDQAFDVHGEKCEASVVRLGDRARTTVVVRFTNSGYGVPWTEDWYFDVTQNQLKNLTPRPEDGFGALLDSEILDIDNDGSNEVVATHHRVDPASDADEGYPDPYLVAYALRSNGLQPVRVIRYLQAFTRLTERPTTERSNITLEASAVGTYRIHILNGSAAGSNRVSSAHVSINGREIASPSDFNQQTPVIVREVTLDKENEVEVLIDSKPGSTITIEAEPIATVPSSSGGI